MQTDTTSLTGFPQSRQWRAEWIWNNQAPRRNGWVLFRTEFQLDECEGVRLYISADTRYRVWINDILVGDGPPQSQPYHQYYDERDIEPFLNQGTNTIAVVVNHQGVQSSTRGGLLAEVSDNRGTIVAATSRDWRCMVGSAWRSDSHFYGGNKIGPFQEHVDLRKMPQQWRENGFDDSRWQSPMVIGERGHTTANVVMPWCRMVPRDIEFLTETRVYATDVHTAEECLDLKTRHCTENLTISLSQAGRALEWAHLDEPSNLLTEDGTTSMMCSTLHNDKVTDGRYDPCLTLDFGRVITGYAEIEVEAPDGALVEIGYAERLVDGRFNNAIECPFADCVRFAAGDDSFRPLIWRSFRYLRLRLKYCETPLKLRSVHAIEIRYPYQPRGSFNGDKRLEQIFDICRNTIDLCSIESLMDTPFREQAQWLGDVAAVTVPGILACYGNTDLPGKFIKQAAINTRPTGLLANLSNIATTNWQNDIPDYSLWWVVAMWRYYEYSGDERYLHSYYPEMQRIMRTHLERINSDGLVDPMFGWVFIDWAHVDVKGISAPYNAIFTAACDAAVNIALVKGDQWAVAQYGQAAAGIRQAFEGVFCEPATGLVVDAVDNGVQSQRISEQGNAAAIAFDCVSADTADRILRKVFDKCTVETTEAQPFFMVVVLEALRKRSRVDLALRLIEDRWGKRMVDRGRTSCTEEWYENGSWRDGYWQGFERTHSHAWSSCAAEFLIRGLAGIEITKPGCKQLRVQPAETGFDYTITYPAPQGNLTINMTNGGVTIESPDGLEVVQ